MTPGQMNHCCGMPGKTEPRMKSQSQQMLETIQKAGLHPRASCPCQQEVHKRGSLSLGCSRCVALLRFAPRPLQPSQAPSLSYSGAGLYLPREKPHGSGFGQGKTGTAVGDPTQLGKPTEAERKQNRLASSNSQSRVRLPRRARENTDCWAPPQAWLSQQIWGRA